MKKPILQNSSTNFRRGSELGWDFATATDRSTTRTSKRSPKSFFRTMPIVGTALSRTGCFPWAARPTATAHSHSELHNPSNRSEEHTSELQSRLHLVCRLLLEKTKANIDRDCPAPKNWYGCRRLIPSI